MRHELTDLAVLLKAAREAKGLSQRELGELVGVPQSHLSKIESGRVDLRVSSLIEIARALSMELTLVPRKALPAIKSMAQGSVRASGIPKASQPTIQKELKRIQSTVAGLIRKNPANEQLAQFQGQVKALQQLRVPDSYRRTMKEAENNLRSMQQNTDDLSAVRKILWEFQQLRNTLAHATGEVPEIDTGRPAYSLDDDDG